MQPCSPRLGHNPPASPHPSCLCAQLVLHFLCSSCWPPEAPGAGFCMPYIRQETLGLAQGPEGIQYSSGRIRVLVCVHACVDGCILDPSACVEGVGGCGHTR